MREKKLVSIVIPYYNSSNYFNRLFKSIIEQTYSFYEVIIIDDNSTPEENLKQRLNKINNEKFYYFENKENKGVSYTRNFGLKLAKGDYIVFLDSDDFLHKNWLEQQVTFLDQNNDYVSVGSSVNYIDKNNIPLNIKKKSYSKTIDIISYKSEYISCPSFYLHKTNYIKDLSFDVELSSSADKFFLLTLLDKYKVGLNNEAIGYYNIDSNSMSNKLNKKILYDRINFAEKVIRNYSIERKSLKIFKKKCYKIICIEAYKLKNTVIFIKYYFKWILIFQ